MRIVRPKQAGTAAPSFMYGLYFHVFSARCTSSFTSGGERITSAVVTLPRSSMHIFAMMSWLSAPPRFLASSLGSLPDTLVTAVGATIDGATLTFGAGGTGVGGLAGDGSGGAGGVVDVLATTVGDGEGDGATGDGATG